jgi:hypothetical protein
MKNQVKTDTGNPNQNYSQTKKTPRLKISPGTQET